jgi:hypothetical protein
MFPKAVAILPVLSHTLSVFAAPTASVDSVAKRGSGPSINVIFFSDSNCQNTVPPTIYTRPVYGDEPCHYNSSELYSSLIIDEIDDQFIGTNSALEVGYATGDTCDWTHSLKYSVATRDTVGQCQFIGIPTGMGKPTMGGNEYRLTTLMG